MLQGLLEQATGLHQLTLQNFFSGDGANAEVQSLANYTGLDALNLSCHESLTALPPGAYLQSAPAPAVGVAVVCMLL